MSVCDKFKHYGTCNYPHSTPGVMDLGSLLVKSEDLFAPATLSSSLDVTATTNASLLLGVMQGGSTLPSAKSQADDSPLLRSLSPILPLSQASPGMGQEVSLANVFVPLDAIKPSRFHEICCMFLFVCFIVVSNISVDFVAFHDMIM